MPSTAWFDMISILSSTKMGDSFTQLQACNFITKETVAQMFSREFCEIFKNSFSTEQLWATASENHYNGETVAKHY